MKGDSRQTAFVVFTTVILLLSVTAAAAQETDYQLDSTDLQIYRDGLVRVTQTLSVNETIAAVSLPLLSSSADNYIVLDENQTVLDYEVEGNNLTVLTLGATSVSLQYDTHSLTSKDGEVWTINVDTPYNMTVQLPEDSTVVYLSETPTSIDMEDNILTLFPSQWEISYVIPLTPPANFQISDLSVTPLEVKKGEEVTVSVKVTNVGGQSGSYTVSLLINQTTEETKSVTLDAGASTTTEFKITKQTSGTYNIEIEGLTDQLTVSEDSPNGGTPNGGDSNGDSFPIEYIAAAVAAVALIIVVVFFLFIKRKPNVEKIVKLHPQLNKEEQDVIQFLSENEGKAFESQIRERFPEIPRTSLWRLVRRLEKLDIVKVQKIGLENQVELKK
ncbi:MAG: hypothetical protein CW716_04725 [Candidatus Bathyarchaeum sp.]|nr:MAG: hypothetical protein CW716_04725 [Candidatus Bathyarchaeum sp.]